MGALFGGSPSGGGAAPQYVQPPAPGTLQQTVLSGNPNGRPNLSIPPVGETEEERRRRLALQSNILGGSDGANGGTGNSAAADAAAEGDASAAAAAGTGEGF